MSNFDVPIFGRLAWVDVLLLVWFGLVVASTVYVAWDAFTKNPEMTVMKWGWVLVTLFLGPISLAMYVLTCKEPSPGAHEEFIRPLWKQGLGSTIHCVAGDATGIVIAATVTAVLGLPMWIDLFIEYFFGFAFGLLIFQALFMRDMLGGSYLLAVRKTVLSEWLSMNTMMAGMFPTMVILMMGRDMRAMDPTKLVFWGTMSVAVLVGLIVAYPVNVWLVQVGLKHGMGTVRAIGQGGHDVESDTRKYAATGTSAPHPQVVALRASEVAA